MRDHTKQTAIQAGRPLSMDEILAVSGGGGGGGKGRGDGLGGLRRALGGGLLGEIATEIVHTGRRAARTLPLPIF